MFQVAKERMPSYYFFIVLSHVQIVMEKDKETLAEAVRKSAGRQSR